MFRYDSLKKKNVFPPFSRNITVGQVNINLQKDTETGCKFHLLVGVHLRSCLGSNRLAVKLFVTAYSPI